MESMARDLRHPYIPSTTVLGDTFLGMPQLLVFTFFTLYPFTNTDGFEKASNKTLHTTMVETAAFKHRVIAHINFK